MDVHEGDKELLKQHRHLSSTQAVGWDVEGDEDIGRVMQFFESKEGKCENYVEEEQKPIQRLGRAEEMQYYCILFLLAKILPSA